jgi:hypothetical protein
MEQKDLLLANPLGSLELDMRICWMEWNWPLQQKRMKLILLKSILPKYFVYSKSEYSSKHINMLKTYFSSVIPYLAIIRPIFLLLNAVLCLNAPNIESATSE